MCALPGRGRRWHRGAAPLRRSWQRLPSASSRARAPGQRAQAREVAIKHAYEVEKRVVARHGLAGFDGGDVHLRKANAASQLELAPSALAASIFELADQIFGQAVQTGRFHM